MLFQEANFVNVSRLHRNSLNEFFIFYGRFGYYVTVMRETNLRGRMCHTITTTKTYTLIHIANDL